MGTNATDFYLKQLSPLIGCKVTGLVRTGDEDDEEFFGIVFTAPNGKKRTLLFLRDDEGNGPGSFELQ
jgi:hypothetical protein